MNRFGFLAFTFHQHFNDICREDFEKLHFYNVPKATNLILLWSLDLSKIWWKPLEPFLMSVLILRLCLMKLFSNFELLIKFKKCFWNATKIWPHSSFDENRNIFDKGATNTNMRGWRNSPPPKSVFINFSIYFTI